MQLPGDRRLSPGEPWLPGCSPVYDLTGQPGSICTHSLYPEEKQGGRVPRAPPREVGRRPQPSSSETLRPGQVAHSVNSAGASKGQREAAAAGSLRRCKGSGESLSSWCGGKPRSVFAPSRARSAGRAEGSGAGESLLWPSGRPGSQGAVSSGAGDRDGRPEASQCHHCLSWNSPGHQASWIRVVPGAPAPSLTPAQCPLHAQQQAGPGSGWVSTAPCLHGPRAGVFGFQPWTEWGGLHAAGCPCPAARRRPERLHDALPRGQSP